MCVCVCVCVIYIYIYMFFFLFLIYNLYIYYNHIYYKDFGESGKNDNDSMVGKNIPSSRRICSRETRDIKHIYTKKSTFIFFLIS